METFMKFFDLFCGVGGFRLGMERNGNVCIGSCEIDTYARQTYAKNFGHEPEFRDARDIDPARLPDFQCLCAGFPCQAFSIAGVRRGFEDTRGTLFFEIVRIAREKQPPILFLENVKGLLSHDKGQTFRVMLQTLDELGYDCEWQIINSKYFVPQNRERIFIIGHLRGSGSRKILPIGESNQIDVNSKQIQHSSTITANYWKGDGAGRPFIAESKKVTMVMNANKNSNMKKRVQERDETWTLTGNGNDFKVCEEQPKLLGWSKSTRDWGVESRIKEGEANTLNTGKGCSNQSTSSFVLNNYRIRRLTPIECERLQGFPDGWTDRVSDTQRYRQMGNAITVDVVQYIASFFSLD